MVASLPTEPSEGDLFQDCVELVLPTATPDTLRYFSSVYDEVCTILRTQGLPDTLYCVLDEAQVALDAMSECFEETALRVERDIMGAGDGRFVLVCHAPRISRLSDILSNASGWVNRLLMAVVDVSNSLERS